MSAHHAGFRSREEMQREQALAGQYRQIGIRAVASANIAAQSGPRQMQASAGAAPQNGAGSSLKPQQQR